MDSDISLELKQKKELLNKQIQKGWNLYALLDKAGLEKTPKAYALYALLKDLEKQEAEIQLQLASNDVDKFLSDVGGIRVAD